MAHNLTPSDLLYPKGDLPLSLFPDKAEGKTAEDALTLWLDEAQGKITTVPPASQNDAARHYVYAKAYRAQANRLGVTPSKKNEAGGNAMTIGTEWGSDRVTYWSDKADAEDAAFQAIVTPPVVKQPIPTSGSVRLRAVW